MRSYTILLVFSLAGEILSQDNPFAPKPPAVGVQNPFASNSGSGSGVTGTDVGFDKNPFATGSGGVGTASGGYQAGGTDTNPFGKPPGGDTDTPIPGGGGLRPPDGGFVDPDQAYADSVCTEDPNYGPAYMARRDSLGEWECVLKPVAQKPKPCFGEKYTSPKDGSPGCCPRGKPFSVGASKMEGACCDVANSFQELDTPARSGECCPAGHKYSATCKDTGSFLYDVKACPALHRNTRITPSGPKFDLFCGTQTQRKNIKVVPAASFIACVDACGDTDGCLGVDWSHTTKLCYMKSEAMDEDTPGAVNPDVDCATTPPVQCPDDNGKIYKKGDKSYKLLCNVQMMGLSNSEPATSFAECVNLCNKKPNCIGCNFDTLVSGSSQCWFTYTSNILQNPSSRFHGAILYDPFSCPDIDGQKKKIGGVEWQFSCSKPVTTTSHSNGGPANSAEECALLCSKKPNCNGANFRTSDKGCFHHTIYQNPPAGNELGFVSFVPTSKRG